MTTSEKYMLHYLGYALFAPGGGKEANFEWFSNRKKGKLTPFHLPRIQQFQLKQKGWSSPLTITQHHGKVLGINVV